MFFKTIHIMLCTFIILAGIYSIFEFTRHGGPDSPRFNESTVLIVVLCAIDLVLIVLLTWFSYRDLGMAWWKSLVYTLLYMVFFLGIAYTTLSYAGKYFSDYTVTVTAGILALIGGFLPMMFATFFSSVFLFPLVVLTMIFLTPYVMGKFGQW